MFDWSAQFCSRVSDAIIGWVNHCTVHYRVTALSLQFGEA